MNNQRLNAVLRRVKVETRGLSPQRRLLLARTIAKNSSDRMTAARLTLRTIAAVFGSDTSKELAAVVKALFAGSVSGETTSTLEKESLSPSQSLTLAPMDLIIAFGAIGVLGESSKTEYQNAIRTTEAAEAPRELSKTEIERRTSLHVAEQILEITRKLV